MRENGPVSGPFFSLLLARELAGNLVRDFGPRLAHAFARDAHVIADHVPVDHGAMLRDGRA